MESFDSLMFLNVVVLGRTPLTLLDPPLTDSVSGKLLANFSEMLTPPLTLLPPLTRYRSLQYTLGGISGVVVCSDSVRTALPRC